MGHKNLACSKCGSDVHEEVRSAMIDLYKFKPEEVDLSACYDEDGNQNVNWLCKSCIYSGTPHPDIDIEASLQKLNDLQATDHAIEFLNGSTVTAKVQHRGPAIAAPPRPFPAHEEWEIPSEELKVKCIKLSKELSKKHPNWRSDKVARKVAEYFKLKKKKRDGEGKNDDVLREGPAEDI